MRHLPASPAAAAVLLAVLLGAAPASAHVLLTSPTSRYGAEMKIGPCGRLGGGRTANVTTYAPGQVVTVVFDELIDHPGYYRIAFDPSGDAALAPPVYDAGTQAWSNPAGVQVLADRIPDASGALTHGAVAVTLPDVECTACTLQLIQVMTDKPPFDGGDDFYYQCADLVLSRAAGGGTPPPPPPPTVTPPAGPSGGCATSGGAAGLAGLLALLALGWRGRVARPR